MSIAPSAAYRFASKLQAFAESQGVRVTSIRAENRNEKKDFLSVYFSVPRSRTENGLKSFIEEPDNELDGTTEQPNNQTDDEPVEDVEKVEDNIL